MSYDQLTQIAVSAKPFVALIDPDENTFLPAGNMPSRIVEYCKRTGQTPPSGKGEMVRCALESLALKYRWVLEKLEAVWGRSICVLHIVGGGTQNKLLCQFAADATGLPVIAGPIEATAIGNIMVQALANGLVRSLSQARAVVHHSFDVVTYEPQDSARWDDAYERFLAVTRLPGGKNFIQ